MSQIENEEEAIARATEFLKMKGVRFATCIGAAKVPGEQNELWRSDIEGNTQEGNEIWQVNFQSAILQPDTADSNNSFSVFIDCVTKACGMYRSM